MINLIWKDRDIMWGNFLMEYLKSPRTIGAIAPSSRKLAEKMADNIDYENTDGYRVIGYFSDNTYASIKILNGEDFDFVISNACNATKEVNYKISHIVLAQPTDTEGFTLADDTTGTTMPILMKYKAPWQRVLSSCKTCLAVLYLPKLKPTQKLKQKFMLMAVVLTRKICPLTRNHSSFDSPMANPSMSKFCKQPMSKLI